MPVYIRFDGVEGSVRGSGNGGVWKTTNFLTGNSARSGPGGGPRVNVFSGSNGGSLIQVSRVSLLPNGGGVDGRDPSVRFKIEQMINSARSQGSNGKLYVATDAGVYQNGIDGHGRVLVGNDQGVWRSGGANKFNGSNNLRQLGLAAHNASVEFIVTDDAGNTLSIFRLERASVSRHPGGINVGLCDGSVKF